MIDYDLVALCIVREAGGEGSVGMTAVGCVIRNRVIYRNQTPTEVIMAKLQFSSMTDPNDPQVIANKKLSDYGAVGAVAFRIAHDVFDNDAPDVTNGADMYYADSLHLTPPNVPRGWGEPSAYIFTVKIGHHNFFKEIK